MLLQALELGLLLQTRTVSLVATLLALGGWFFVNRLKSLTFSLSRWAAIAASGLLGCYYLIPDQTAQFAYIGSDLAFLLACFCLSVQLLLVLHARFRQRLPYWFLLLSSLGMIIGADARVEWWQRDTMLWLMLAYLPLWAAFAAGLRDRAPNATPHRWQFDRSLVAGACLLVAGLSTWGVSSFVRDNQDTLEQWFIRSLMQSQINFGQQGFSGTGGIHDISHVRSEQEFAVALRVQAAARPGYLRAQAFNRFANDYWMNTNQRDDLLPSPRMWESEGRNRPLRQYLLDESAIDQSESLIVWTAENSVRRFLFLPRKAAAVVIGADRLLLQAPGVLQQVDDDGPASYTVFSSRRTEDEPGDLTQYLQLPADLHPAVASLADELYREQYSAADKMQATQSFLRLRCGYSMDISTPPHRQRLEYFLNEGRLGNCEYFATASVILLRRGGVPARYVTGFLVSEQNPVDGLWLARHKDAHAWVEAWDDVRREWVIVESTPDAGIPARHEMSTWSHWSEVAEQMINELLEFMASGGLTQWLRDHWYAAPAVLLLLLLARRFWQIRSFKRAVRSQGGEADEQIASLVRERISLDRHLQRRGLSRTAGETVLGFADRIERQQSLPDFRAVAQWYRHYSELRFRDQPLGTEDLLRLRLQRRSLSRSARSVS